MKNNGIFRVLVCTMFLTVVSVGFKVKTCKAQSWERKQDFPGLTRNFPTGFSLGNKAYMGTGENFGTYFKDFWQYDLLTENSRIFSRK